MMHCLSALSVVSIVWVLWGYSFAFGPGDNGVFGGFSYLGFHDVGQSPKEGLTIPTCCSPCIRGYSRQSLQP